MQEVQSSLNLARQSKVKDALVPVVKKITDEFVIVGINFKTGNVISENPLHWKDGKHVMVQQGKVMFLKCGK